MDSNIPKKLYKTTIVIWSEYDGSEAELHDLAFQAEEGDAYCSVQRSVEMTREQIEADPDWDGNEFFTVDACDDEDGDIEEEENRGED